MNGMAECLPLRDRRFCNTILNYWFKDAKSYTDVTTTDFREWRGKSMSLQEVFLVNHSPSQAKERERMITAISGLTCSGPYMRSGPIGSLVRTLLASSRWYSPVRRLKWEVNPLYSERVSLYLKDDSNMLLKPFAVILNAKDIPSSRYLYRLVPSVHLTDGIEFGLSPTIH